MRLKETKCCTKTKGNKIYQERTIQSDILISNCQSRIPEAFVGYYIDMYLKFYNLQPIYDNVERLPMRQVSTKNQLTQKLLDKYST